MFNYFKNFLKHSGIYGLGNTINRGASFLLVPLYTRVLSPTEYGALEMFLVVAGALQTFLGMRLAHATLRFYFEFDNERDRKQVMSTTLIASLGISAVAILLLRGFASELSNMIFKSIADADLFDIVFILVLLELSKEIFLAYLRAREKSWFYISVAIVQMAAQLGFNLYFVLVLHMGVRGILIGNLISAGITWIILGCVTFKYCGLDFDLPKLALVGKYCSPFILAAAAEVVLNSADRVMLNNYKSLAVLGIYALAMKFGIGIRDLFVVPFTLNFGQSRFAIMKQPDAKKIYAKTLTYFLFVLTFISLGVALFSKEVLVLISAPAFVSAYKVIPLMLLSVIMAGVSYILQTGILIEKKTKYMFYITVCSSLMVLLLNYIFIPLFSLYGAALATAATSFFTCLSTYLISNRLHPINYELGRLVKIFIAGMIICFTGTYCLEAVYLTFAGEIVIKLLLFLSFPLTLHAMSFYKSEERLKIKECFVIARRQRRRGNLKHGEIA